MGEDLPVTRVAIIGAGASGLTQLKQLLDAFARPEVRKRTRLEVVVFETKRDVGGVWYVVIT
jgi:cation diffusion facilitator CzcD-associated flavoprotein CzcO